MKRLTSITVAVFTAAFFSAAAYVNADSNIDQRTFLTFSGPVQMPGVTLPAGKYVFRLADTSLHSVMQVYDDHEKHIIGQWFFVPVNRTTEEMNKANGKPVVTFLEVPAGVAPPIQYFFYPTDLTGKEFIYPKNQAVKIAAASQETVLATETETTKGGEANVVSVAPNGNENEYQASAETRSTAPAASEQTSEPPVATSGAADQTPAPASSEPRQVASELPKTASSIPFFGLIGFLTLAAGFGLRFARIGA